MASKSTLNAKNLQALGAERLAQLLIEISTGDAAAKRKLRLALAAAEGLNEAAGKIAKRLTRIAPARTFVNWQNRQPLVKDLETKRRAIMEQIAAHDPREAVALLLAHRVSPINSLGDRVARELVRKPILLNPSCLSPCFQNYPARRLPN